MIENTAHKPLKINDTFLGSFGGMGKGIGVYIQQSIREGCPMSVTLACCEAKRPTAKAITSYQTGSEPHTEGDHVLPDRL